MRIITTVVVAVVVQSEYNVAMTCESCARAVRGVLKNVKGIEKVDTDVATQKVVVHGSANPDEVLAAIKKTGKAASRSA
jgi:copper chaperone CopZ